MTLLVNQFRNEEAVQNRENVNLDATADAKRVVLFDSSGNEIGSGSSTLVGDGRQVVTTAGTRVQLSASSVHCKRVTICAETDNTGFIVVGGTTVVAALATRR